MRVAGVEVPAQDSQGLMRLRKRMGYLFQNGALINWLTVARNLDVRGMTSIDLPGKPLFEGGVYRGEKFPPGVRGFFAAVAEDRVAAFLVDHPKVVTIDR